MIAASSANIYNILTPVPLSKFQKLTYIRNVAYELSSIYDFNAFPTWNPDLTEGRETMRRSSTAVGSTKSKLTLSRGRYTETIQCYIIYRRSSVPRYRRTRARNPINVDDDDDGLTDGRMPIVQFGQLFINYIHIIIIIYIAVHRPPRDRRHNNNIFHPFTVASFAIFFFYTHIYTSATVVFIGP